MELDVYVLRDTREPCAMSVLCLTASTDSCREIDASAMQDGQEHFATHVCIFVSKIEIILSPFGFDSNENLMILSPKPMLFVLFHRIGYFTRTERSERRERI